MTAAELRTTVPRSLHFVTGDVRDLSGQRALVRVGTFSDSPKTTFSPSFHISVTRVSPGKRTPAKRTLMSLNAPNLRKMCLAEMPNEHRPCAKVRVCQRGAGEKGGRRMGLTWRMGWSKPPTLAKLGSTWSGFKSPERR